MLWTSGTSRCFIFFFFFFSDEKNRDLEQRFVRMISTGGYVEDFVKAQAGSARKKPKEAASPVAVAEGEQ